MTPDELAAELYRRQGKLFIVSELKLKIGEKVRGETACLNGNLEAALYVTGEGSREQFMEQDKLGRFLEGIERLPHVDWDFYRYIYRVEAD